MIPDTSLSKMTKRKVMMMRRMMMMMMKMENRRIKIS
jgi:hypothetical protein